MGNMPIMTDALFVLHGGRLDESTGPVRLLAYTIAEDLIAEHLGTFLSPTIVTGVFVRPISGWDRIMLPHLHLWSVRQVVGLYDQSQPYGTLEATGTAYIHDSISGIIRLVPPHAPPCAGCGDSLGLPDRYRVVYEAGFASGTVSSNERALLALTIQSQKILNQIVDPAANEGGAGDPGVQSWTEAGHSEQRVELLRTTFGTSALDNLTVTLLSKLAERPALRIP